MRSLTTSEVIQALLEAGQPHAKVEVRGRVPCERDGTRAFQQRVTGVRTEHNLVVVEVER